MNETETDLQIGEFSENFPLDEPLVSRFGIVGFPGDHDKLIELYKGQMGLEVHDVRFLGEFPKIDVFYGAGSNRIYPFITVPDIPLTSLATAREVLAMLRASCFESEHITSLDVATVPFPGYHPHTKNDEIHSNNAEQHLFARENRDDEEREDYHDDPEGIVSEYLSRGCHEALKSLVLDSHLYYVLVHAKPRKIGEYEASDYVILFGVGVSRNSGNLIGVVSRQLCHNLCD